MKSRFKYQSQVNEIVVEKSDGVLTINLGDSSTKIELINSKNGSFLFKMEGKVVKGYAVREKDVVHVRVFNRNWVFNEVTDDEVFTRGAGAGNAVNVVSPMPGSVIKVLVEEGQEIAAEEPLVIVEAMKMENEVRAPNDVTIDRIHVKAGQQVGAGEVLIDFVKADAPEDVSI